MNDNNEKIVDETEIQSIFEEKTVKILNALDDSPSQKKGIQKLSSIDLLTSNIVEYLSKLFKSAHENDELLTLATERMKVLISEASFDELRSLIKDFMTNKNIMNEYITSLFKQGGGVNGGQGSALAELLKSAQRDEDPDQKYGEAFEAVSSAEDLSKIDEFNRLKKQFE